MMLRAAYTERRLFKNPMQDGENNAAHSTD